MDITHKALSDLIAELMVENDALKKQINKLSADVEKRNKAIYRKDSIVRNLQEELRKSGNRVIYT
ncbi:MAG: hypothetical protein KDI74_04875 [Gammaproteobacteria bacterium]|nr:hypothetical protein [Gammaproteobacteria bacterium]